MVICYYCKRVVVGQIEPGIVCHGKCNDKYDKRIKNGRCGICNSVRKGHLLFCDPCVETDNTTFVGY